MITIGQFWWSQQRTCQYTNTTSSRLLLCVCVNFQHLLIWERLWILLLLLLFSMAHNFYLRVHYIFVSLCRVVFFPFGKLQSFWMCVCAATWWWQRLRGVVRKTRKRKMKCRPNMCNNNFYFCFVLFHFYSLYCHITWKLNTGISIILWPKNIETKWKREN